MTLTATQHVCVQLAQAREALNLTQADLVRRSGRTHSRISTLESGRNSPSVETIATYAGWLGVDAITITIPAKRESRQ